MIENFNDAIDVLNVVLFWIYLPLLLWFAYIVLVNKGVPNIPTAPAIRRKVIGVLKADMAQKGGDSYTVIDLGSGSGSFARMIAKEMPQARVIGVEWDKRLCGWADFFKRLYRVPNVDYVHANFDDYNVAHADGVVLFLTAYNMHSMGKKLNAELKPGAIVACNRFLLKDGWSPVETLEVKTLVPLQGRLNVYRR